MQVFRDELLISRTATLTFVTKFALVGHMHLQQQPETSALHAAATTFEK